MFKRLFVFSTLMVPVLCSADFEATYRKQGDPSNTSSMSIRNGDVLMGDQQATLLYRAETRDIVAINHEAKSYFVFDEATTARLEQQMSEMQQRMASVMQQLESQTGQMSEEQRAMMQRMLEQQGMGAQAQGAPRMTVKAAGKGRVAGMSCQKYRVLENGRPATEACVVPPASVGMSTADYRALLTATDTMRGMVERMTGGFARLSEMDFRALDGVPVQMRDLGDGSVSTLASHSDAKLAASAFRIPDGYRQREIAR